jgi:uncharacterized protein (DUF1501 family)
MVLDPALQLWLNGPANHRRQPNENLSRELLELRGGNDGLNTVAPVRDPLYQQARPTLTLQDPLPLADGLAEAQPQPLQGNQRMGQRIPQR